MPSGIAPPASAFSLRAGGRRLVLNFLMKGSKGCNDHGPHSGSGQFGKSKQGKPQMDTDEAAVNCVSAYNRLH